MENKIIKNQELDILMEWVSDTLASTYQVPRLDDVIRHAHQMLGFQRLTRSDISKRLRLHPAYLMNSPQQRVVRRSKRYRPIIANTLGVLHGDIGFFARTREYETPLKYRGGFLVLKDVLSRFLYTINLGKDRTANSMIKAFEALFKKHQEVFGPNGHKIKSIAFDRETSVMSKRVQEFLRENNISFHAFKYSSSKSKMAENAIRLLRTNIRRNLSVAPKNVRWWHVYEKVVDELNNKLLVVNKKILNWRPRDINKDNVEMFLNDVHKADPSHLFGQYEVAPQLVQFKYQVGSIVRPKLIITSSAVIGEKRSEVNLEKDPFIVEDRFGYVNARSEIGNAYRCTNLNTRETEIFDEGDLAESIE